MWYCTHQYETDEEKHCSPRHQVSVEQAFQHILNILRSHYQLEELHCVAGIVYSPKSWANCLS
jgi:hypothetical protein